MVSCEASATTSATPEQAWEAWTDVSRWAEGDHVESAELKGGFAVGGIIRTHARGFPASTLTLTRVERPRVWVDESRSPGVRMTFEHVIEPVDGGTKVTERALISGPLAWLVGALMKRKLEALFDASTAQVVNHAERVPGPGPRAGAPD
jgi:hypothetical protein